MKIVICGGGFAGIKAALELAKIPKAEVQLISKSENFEYHGALYRSGTGRSPLEVVMPLRDIFKNKNIDYQLDQIMTIEPDKQRVISETGNVYSYDKVIFALGNTLNYFGLKNADQLTYSLDTIANTIRLRHKLTELFKSPKTKIAIAVVGAGPSGVELAGELQNYADMVASRYKTKRKEIDVHLIDAASRVLPNLMAESSLRAEKRLVDLGVNLHLNSKAHAVEPDRITTNKETIGTDCIVWTAGSKVVSFFEEHPRVFTIVNNRVDVDQYLNAIAHPDIYVIGDNANTPHAGMASTALRDAKFVTNNIKLQLKDKEPIPYRPKLPIYSVPIGKSWAIVQDRSRVISGRIAWLIRRKADLDIYRNFKPYQEAVKTWKKGNKLAQF